MHERICDLINAVAYPDAPLRTGRGNSSRLPPSGLTDSPLVLIDTSARRIPGNNHKANAVHEATIHEFVRGLQYDGVLTGRKWRDLARGDRPTDRMAVISPYKDQVRSLQRSLKHRFGDDYDGLVDTVHRFQGSQRPLVVLDTVAGAGRKPGTFYDGTGLRSSTCRLLNVALSRAQDHLVVVADIEYLRHHLTPHSEAATMLAHLERNAVALSVDELIPTRQAADLAGLTEHELNRPAFFPADEVERAVQWDIARATGSIEIYCAFLDPNPVRKWLRQLKPRIERGVRVTVFTRHTPDKAHLVEELRRAGCSVDERERMHEKIVIIDESVLWHGSLNLLANKGPTDLMMRLTDPESCARVTRIMGRARMERPVQQPPKANSEPQDGYVKAGNVKPGKTVGDRLYLNVPYEEKDQAKRQVRARWDADVRLWWVDKNGVSREQVRRWLPDNEES